MTNKDIKKTAKWFIENFGAKWGSPGKYYSVNFTDFDHDPLIPPEDVQVTILELANELD